MSRATMGASRIVGQRTIGGNGHTRGPQTGIRPILRPTWADDPTLDLPCQRPEVDADWWFDAITSEGGQDMREYATALCQGCPMRDPCRDYAVAAPRELYGVWGGLLMERAYPRNRGNRKGATAS